MRRPVLLAGVLLAWGCGHEVAPAGGYDDGAAVPGPENFTATVEFARVNLTWDTPDDVFAVIDGWILERAYGPDTESLGPFTPLTPEPHQDQIYVDVHVEDGLLYVYRIRAVTPAGVFSDPETVSVLVDLTPPSPPTGLTAEQDARDGLTFVRVSWEPPAGERFPTYHVFRLPPFPNFDRVVTPFDYVEDFSVEPLITYRYWVVALDEARNQSEPTGVVLIEVQP